MIRDGACHKSAVAFGLMTAFLTSHQAFGAVTNYIPATISLVNNAGPKTNVCVIGASLQQTATATLPPVFPYKLVAGGTWARSSPGAKVTALNLGTDLTSITPSAPGDSPYLNSARVRFYVVPSSVACSTITYAITDTKGDTDHSAYPYPSALLELSAYQSGNANVLTIDDSTVDNFQIPLTMEFKGGGKQLGKIGNPLAATATRRTMITGPDGTGVKSPFLRWLALQPAPRERAETFRDLALPSVDWPKKGYPFAMIQSPTDFLAAQCGTTVPADCGLAARFLHWTHPLNSYYDDELSNFFKYAEARGNQLIVMGDAAGKLPDLAWHATSNKADCPMYLNHDGKSLQFQYELNDKKMSPMKLVVCNPVGQMAAFDGAPDHIIYAKTKNGTGNTAFFRISQPQFQSAYGHATYDAKIKGKYVGWNFGQIETSVTGYVTDIFERDGAYYIGAILLDPNPTTTDRQAVCTKLSSCTFNPQFKLWAFSNIVAGAGVKVFESPSQMVFGNDGAFGGWTYYDSSIPYTVVTSIQRNIVAALSRGIANCNNVTMPDSAIRPDFCKKIELIKSKDFLHDEGVASDRYWSDETNWYPDGGPQNYYSQYLHTAKLDTKGLIAPPSCLACMAIFHVPNGLISLSSAKSNQGISMGMAYGFPFDENPDYLRTVIPQQVPSKLDPIPTGFGQGVAVTVTIGNSQ